MRRTSGRSGSTRLPMSAPGTGHLVFPWLPLSQLDIVFAVGTWPPALQTGSTCREGAQGGGESRLTTRGIAGNIDQGLDTGLKKLRIDPYKLRPWMREPPAPPTADQTGYIPPPPPKPPWWSPRLWLFTFIGSAFYGVLFVPFIFAILQEAVSEGVAISPFGSEVYVSRGSWIAAFVFLATVSIYTMGVFNMALSAYMYSILLLTIVLLVLLQQARP